MAGALYDEHAHKDPDSDNELVCYGRSCYFTTALICAIGCGVAVLLALGMAHFTKKRYTQLYGHLVKAK